MVRRTSLASRSTAGGELLLCELVLDQPQTPDWAVPPHSGWYSGRRESMWGHLLVFAIFDDS
jgi:hypothetical protein